MSALKTALDNLRELVNFYSDELTDPAAVADNLDNAALELAAKDAQIEKMTAENTSLRRILAECNQSNEIATLNASGAWSNYGQFQNEIDNALKCGDK